MSEPLGEHSAPTHHEEIWALHVPVMVEEILSLLETTQRGVVCDGTCSLGGHTVRLAQHLAPEGLLLALDRDTKVLPLAQERLQGFRGVIVKHGLFQDMPEILAEMGVASVDYILIDAGLSGYQLADDSRGFAISSPGAFDLRMTPDSPLTGADVVNRFSEKDLADLLYTLGGECKARRVAAELVKTRNRAPIRSTGEVVQAIRRAVGGGPHHAMKSARKCLQGVRITVNAELDALDMALKKLPPILAHEGLLVCLTYHSLEHGRVRRSFREWSKNGYQDLFKKPLRPTPDEIERNRRSRSAQLRALRRSSLDRTTGKKTSDLEGQILGACSTDRHDS